MYNICLTLSEKSRSSLESKLRHYSGTVPYIEVRLDSLERPELPDLPAGSTRYIATCRPPREGGLFRGSEEERLSLLSRAFESGFSWVDLEHDVPSPGSRGACRIIRSRHFFERFPEDLRKEFESLPAESGEVRKLAVMVSTTSEVVRLLKFMESLPGEASRVILGMGLTGQPSRYLGAFLGNAWTYVAEDGRSTAAPGQFTLGDGLWCLTGDRLGGSTEIYAVLGNPVAHSLSPELHNALFEHFRLDKTYLRFHIDSPEEWMGYVHGSRLPFSGFSVTIPFKGDFARLADRVESPVPAVNTLVRSGARWMGYNTDFPGFIEPLKRRTDLRGKTALVLGNGGVAHTVVSALQREGTRVIVRGRNPRKVARFVSRHSCGSIPSCSLPFRTDLLINTTPVGQFPDTEASPLGPDELDCDLVYDLVYHPEKTRLLRLAREKGIQTISGIEMFVEQAAQQFRIWTGREPSRELMREIAEASLQRSPAGREDESLANDQA